MSPPIFEDEESDFLVYLILFIIAGLKIVSKIAQNATFCNFDPPQSENLTCWQKMIIFEISTLELAKKPIPMPTFFCVLHSVIYSWCVE